MILLTLFTALDTISERRHSNGYGRSHGRRRRPRPSNAVRVRSRGIPGSLRKGEMVLARTIPEPQTY